MNAKLLVVSFLITLLFFSCGNNQKKFTAGFLVHSLQDERWSIERDAFTSKVNELGGSVLFDNAEQDERQQFYLAKKMIDGGIDVLVLVPVNSKTAASIARLCSDNHVKLIAYDIIIENCDLDLYVTFDNEMVGEIMARFALDHQPSGNYVLLWGDSNMKVAQWIKDGQMKILSPAIQTNDVNLVYRGYVENWSGTNSSQMMKKIIDYYNGDIDVVIASADGIAQGVIDAYMQYPDLKIPIITGQDASQTALDNIVKGTQSMTIRKSFKDLAEIAAMNAYKLAVGEAPKPDTFLNNGRMNVPSILLPPSLVDVNTINASK